MCWNLAACVGVKTRWRDTREQTNRKIVSACHPASVNVLSFRVWVWVKTIRHPKGLCTATARASGGNRTANHPTRPGGGELLTHTVRLACYHLPSSVCLSTFGRAFCERKCMYFHPYPLEGLSLVGVVWQHTAITDNLFAPFPCAGEVKGCLSTVPTRPYAIIPRARCVGVCSISARERVTRENSPSKRDGVSCPSRGMG